MALSLLCTQRTPSPPDHDAEEGPLGDTLSTRPLEDYLAQFDGDDVEFYAKRRKRMRSELYWGGAILLGLHRSSGRRGYLDMDMQAALLQSE